MWDNHCKRPSNMIWYIYTHIHLPYSRVTIFLMESSKKILYISTAYFMRMVVVIAVVCQRQTRKKFSFMQFTNKLASIFVCLTKCLPSKKFVFFFSKLFILYELWFFRVLWNAFLFMLIQTLSVAFKKKASLIIITTKKIVFHLILVRFPVSFVDMSEKKKKRNGQTDFHVGKYPVVHILCTQLSNEKFYERYYEILIVSINNEWNA